MKIYLFNSFQTLWFSQLKKDNKFYKERLARFCMEIKADFQNHWTTKSRVLNPHEVAGRILDSLGKGGLCGLVNYSDRRYEAFAERADGLPMVTRLANAVYFAGRDVLVVKGEEVPTADGDLLVMGLNEDKHLSPKKSLEYSLKEAHENEGVVIITTPFFGISRVGEIIQKNPKLLSLVDAIEVHDGEALKSANKKAKEFYNNVIKDYYPHLGQLASSDGHSFMEVGSSCTKLSMPQYSQIHSAHQLRDNLRQAVRESKSDENLHKSNSVMGALIHAGILIPMIIAGKFGIKLSRGDQAALR